MRSICLSLIDIRVAVCQKFSLSLIPPPAPCETTAKTETNRHPNLTPIQSLTGRETPPLANPNPLLGTASLRDESGKFTPRKDVALWRG